MQSAQHHHHHGRMHASGAQASTVADDGCHSTPLVSGVSHSISIAEPPALPKRRACLGTCVVAVGIFWCLATVGMAVAFVATGRSVTESRVARLPLLSRPMELSSDAGARFCGLKVRITDGEATRAEVAAALALSIGNSVNVDAETTVRSIGRRLMAVQFANCDQALEQLLSSDTLQQSWSSNLIRMRGAHLMITEGPDQETQPVPTTDVAAPLRASVPSGVPSEVSPSVQVTRSILRRNRSVSAAPPLKSGHGPLTG